MRDQLVSILDHPASTVRDQRMMCPVFPLKVLAIQRGIVVIQAQFLNQELRYGLRVSGSGDGACEWHSISS
jgi:hypothetical protein